MSACLKRYRVRRQALDQQDVGVAEFLQRGLQWRILHAGNGAQKAKGKSAAYHRANVRHVARRTEPVETRHQRLLQRRRNRVHTALLATLQQKPRHFLDEQRHAASAGGDVLHDIAGSAWRAESSATMSRTWARSRGASEMVP